MTNGDKWRLKTDEQIAESYSRNMFDCQYCEAREFCNTHPEIRNQKPCVEIFTIWLKQEAYEITAFPQYKTAADGMFRCVQCNTYKPLKDKSPNWYGNGFKFREGICNDCDGGKNNDMA